MKMKRWQANAVMIGIMIVVALCGIIAITQIEKRSESIEEQETGHPVTDQWSATADVSPSPSMYPSGSPFPGGFVPPVSSPMPSPSVLPGASALPTQQPTAAPSYVIPSGGQYDINLDWIYLQTLPPIPSIPTVRPSVTNAPTMLPPAAVTEAPVHPATTCTVSISCGIILNHMDQLKEGKEAFVPTNGIILGAASISFTEGESAFDVLKRACANAGVHMESEFAPMYNSDYIKGINQIYEGDCGSQSGWMYKVNGVFPNVGASGYQLKAGDIVEWCFTCDGGADIGGHQ